MNAIDDFMFMRLGEEEKETLERPPSIGKVER